VDQRDGPPRRKEENQTGSPIGRWGMGGWEGRRGEKGETKGKRKKFVCLFLAAKTERSFWRPSVWWEGVGQSNRVPVLLPPYLRSVSVLLGGLVCCLDIPPPLFTPWFFFPRLYFVITLHFHPSIPAVWLGCDDPCTVTLHHPPPLTQYSQSPLCNTHLSPSSSPFPSKKEGVELAV
jgi:hypothetical protein